MAADGVVSGETTQNNHIMETLYKAVSDGDMEKVAGLMAGDLEWWFHGPPRAHHMMKALTTGDFDSAGFRFEPRRLSGISERVVIAEGWEGDAYWVHVWTVSKGGVITQLREYFNTWLTVTETSRLPAVVAAPVWQSQPRDLFRRSLPAVILAI